MTAIFVVAACSSGVGEPQGGTSTLGPTLPVGDPCSASQLPVHTEPRDDLLRVVEGMRLAIVDAAIRCDFQGLAVLAAASDTETFDAGSAVDGDLAAHWSRLEARGDQPLRLLVGILRAPLVSVIRGPAEYQFPSAAAFGTWEETPETVRDSLLEFYGPDAIAEFAAADFYSGYRTAISGEGMWLYFRTEG